MVILWEWHVDSYNCPFNQKQPDASEFVCFWFFHKNVLMFERFRWILRALMIGCCQVVRGVAIHQPGGGAQNSTVGKKSFLVVTFFYLLISNFKNCTSNSWYWKQNVFCLTSSALATFSVTVIQVLMVLVVFSSSGGQPDCWLFFEMLDVLSNMLLQF